MSPRVRSWLTNPRAERTVPPTDGPPTSTSTSRAKIGHRLGKVAKPAAVLVAAIVAWQLVVISHVVPTTALAPPTAVGGYMAGHPGYLITNLAATLVETCVAFGIAIMVGVGLAIAIVEIKFLEDGLLPLLVVSQVVPSIALAPLLVLLLGFGESPKIVVAIIISFFPVLINTVSGLKGMSRDTLNLSRSLRASRWKTLRYFSMPNALPFVFAGARVSITLSIIGAVVGEFVSANRGLGYLVVEGSSTLDPAQMFAALVLLAVMGIALFSLVRVVERFAIPWAFTQGQTS